MWRLCLTRPAGRWRGCNPRDQTKLKGRTMTTQAQARAGEDLSPAAEVSTAVAGFLSEFKGFQSDIHKRLQQQEEKMTMFERKTIAMARPHLARSEEHTSELQ